MSSKDNVSGLLGGALAGGLVTALGLMKVKKITIKSGRTTLVSSQLNPGESKTLLSEQYIFAVILFHGDGDPQVQLTVTVESNTYTLNGDEQAIELITGEQVTITANNTDTATPRNAPTIEIGYLTWRE
jgi:hypothetical protein